MKHKVLPQVEVQCPQAALSIAAKRRLSKMPYFSRHTELRPDRMRDRKRLPKLDPVNPPLEDFIDQVIRVVVKAFYGYAGSNNHNFPPPAHLAIRRLSPFSP